MNDNDTASIRVTGLTKRFGNFAAVDGITFEVKPGEIFGFLGANGAGKPYRRGCLQIVGQPRPVVRGDCDFSFGSSLFVLAVLRGYVLPPPSLGEKAGQDFCCGCGASFCRTVAVRTAVVLQGILSECFSAFLSRRCFGAAVRHAVRCRQASPTPRRSAARRSSYSSAADGRCRLRSVR